MKLVRSAGIDRHGSEGDLLTALVRTIARFRNCEKCTCFSVIRITIVQMKENASRKFVTPTMSHICIIFTSKIILFSTYIAVYLINKNLTKSYNLLARRLNYSNVGWNNVG